MESNYLKIENQNLHLAYFFHRLLFFTEIASKFRTKIAAVLSPGKRPSTIPVLMFQIKFRRISMAPVYIYAIVYSAPIAGFLLYIQ